MLLHLWILLPSGTESVPTAFTYVGALKCTHVQIVAKDSPLHSLAIPKPKDQCYHLNATCSTTKVANMLF